MADAWYYIGPNGRVGPVTVEALRGELAHLPRPGAVVVWKENAPSWSVASDVSGLLNNHNFGDGDDTVSVRAPRDTPAETRKVAIEHDRHDAIAGRFLGAIVILAGCGLVYLGIAGKVTWMAETFGLRGELANASPGAVLFVVGLFLIWGTRHTVI